MNDAGAGPPTQHFSYAFNAREGSQPPRSSRRVRNIDDGDIEFCNTLLFQK